MLREKRINEYFFMDIFSATKKAGKSSRETYVDIYSLQTKVTYILCPWSPRVKFYKLSNSLQRKLARPMPSLQALQENKRRKAYGNCFSETGTTLRYLEEGTPWANKAELCVGLIKEAVRKDMKETKCPLCFWTTVWSAERRPITSCRKVFSNSMARKFLQLWLERRVISPTYVCQFKRYVVGATIGNRKRSSHTLVK